MIRTTTGALVLTMLLSAMTAINCSPRSLSDGEGIGAVGLELILPGGGVVDAVNYQITGNGITPISGSIDVSAPGTTEASALPRSLPAGTYTVAMRAGSGSATCSGAMPFTVVAGQTAMALVVLHCR